MEFDTANLLRPQQVAESKEEIARIEAMVNAPPHVRGRISDMREMRKRYDRLKKELENSTPREYSASERDAAIFEMRDLENQIQTGMPSSEEMRRNPPGAVSKHMAWEKRNKKTIARYKHIALRLQASGDLPFHLKDQGDIANIERLRPLTIGNQLSMQGAQIPKTRDIHIGTDPANTVTFEDEEIALLKATAPEVSDKLSLLPTEARLAIKMMMPALKGTKRGISHVKKIRLSSSQYARARAAAALNGIATFKRKGSEVMAELKEKGIEF